MKIAYVLSNGVLSPSNGIVSQAKTWKALLEDNQHSVTLIDMWENNDWASFDIIHFFGFSLYMRDMINSVYRVNQNIVVSPILDPNYSISKLKIYRKWGSNRLGLTNKYHALNSVAGKVQIFMARSDFEANYLAEGFRIPEAKISRVPLSFRDRGQPNHLNKELFCFHVSLLMDERKNVKRLIEAAKKFKFPLKLAGRIHNEVDSKRLESWIDNCSNIEYLGYLEDNELTRMYMKAKVFALPSLNEGVGIVGVEAASLGCDVVVTNLGGPKEYYGDFAKQVDPYNVNEIGNAIIEFLAGESYQPFLGERIHKLYSHDSVKKELLNAYNRVVETKL